MGRGIREQTIERIFIFIIHCVVFCFTVRRVPPFILGGGYLGLFGIIMMHYHSGLERINSGAVVVGARVRADLNPRHHTVDFK